MYHMHHNQGTSNPQNCHIEDILELIDYLNGDQKDWENFLIIGLVLRIPKMYHMLGKNVKITIKIPKILKINT